MNRLAVVLLIGLVVLFYVRSPIDLLPDRIGLLGLVDDLVLALLAVWWLRHRAAAPRPRMTARQRARGPAGRSSAGTGAGAPPEPVPDGDAWDPYAVLGVPRGASADEVTRAYRAQMKLYHPDRVADLGPELQEVAHRKSIEIQRAYAELSER
jgi:uncharacterized membrane protein YkvA (DUF1232 family)